MATATVTKTVSCIGKTFRQQRTPTEDGALIKDPTLAAAKTGSLTTRTDDNTGTLTMAADHGITTGARLDVYWATGSRLGMTVGTVATNSVPIDGGSGDNLPDAATAVTAMVPQIETFVCTEAELKALFVGCTGVACGAVFRSDAPADVAVVRTEATEDYVWDEADGSTSPFDSDDVVEVYLSHGYSAGSKQVSVVALKT